MAVSPDEQCRVCFKVDQHSLLRPLTDKGTRKLFEDCTSLQVQLEGSSPKALCIVCYHKCVSWQTFKSKAFLADRKINEQISNDVPDGKQMPSPSYPSKQVSNSQVKATQPEFVEVMEIKVEEDSGSEADYPMNFDSRSSTSEEKDVPEPPPVAEKSTIADSYQMPTQNQIVWRESPGPATLNGKPPSQIEQVQIWEKPKLLSWVDKATQTNETLFDFAKNAEVNHLRQISYLEDLQLMVGEMKKKICPPPVGKLPVKEEPSTSELVKLKKKFLNKCKSNATDKEIKKIFNLTFFPTIFERRVKTDCLEMPVVKAFIDVWGLHDRIDLKTPEAATSSTN